MSDENNQSFDEFNETEPQDESVGLEETEEFAETNDPDTEKQSVSSDLIRGHINTIILRSLYDGDRYGYDIISEIEQKSHGQYTMKQPTLYSALKRLQAQGYIKAYWGGVSNGGRRRYYSLTEAGKEVVRQNQAEWEYSRTIIDNLISDEDFDFTNHSAPQKLDFRILRQSTSRTPIVGEGTATSTVQAPVQNSAANGNSTPKSLADMGDKTLEEFYSGSIASLSALGANPPPSPKKEEPIAEKENLPNVSSVNTKSTDSFNSVVSNLMDKSLSDIYSQPITLSNMFSGKNNGGTQNASNGSSSSTPQRKRDPIYLQELNEGSNFSEEVIGQYRDRMLKKDVLPEPEFYPAVIERPAQLETEKIPSVIEQRAPSQLSYEGIPNVIERPTQRYQAPESIPNIIERPTQVQPEQEEIPYVIAQPTPMPQEQVPYVIERPTQVQPEQGEIPYVIAQPTPMPQEEVPYVIERPTQVQPEQKEIPYVIAQPTPMPQEEVPYVIERPTQVQPEQEEIPYVIAQKVSVPEEQEIPNIIEKPKPIIQDMQEIPPIIAERIIPPEPPQEIPPIIAERIIPPEPPQEIPPIIAERIIPPEPPQEIPPIIAERIIPPEPPQKIPPIIAERIIPPEPPQEIPPIIAERIIPPEPPQVFPPIIEKRKGIQQEDINSSSILFNHASDSGNRPVYNAPPQEPPFDVFGQSQTQPVPQYQAEPLPNVIHTPLYNEPEFPPNMAPSGTNQQSNPVQNGNFTTNRAQANDNNNGVYYTAPSASAVNEKIDYSDIKYSAKKDGVRIWASSTDHPSSPANKASSDDFFNKGSNLFISSLVYFIFALIEWVLVLTFRDELFANSILMTAYLSVLTAVTFIVPIVCGILNATHYQSVTRRLKKPTPIENAAVLFIVLFILVVAIDLLLDVTLSDVSMLFISVIVPALYLFNCIIFAVVYYSISRSTK